MQIKSLNIIERGIHKSLGELEAQIMTALWSSHTALSARDITTIITKKKKISFNAITAVLNRLEKKDMVKRIAHGKRYSFEPTMSKKDYSKFILLSGMKSLFSDKTLLSAAGLSGSERASNMDKEAEQAIATLESFLSQLKNNET